MMDNFYNTDDPTGESQMSIADFIDLKFPSNLQAFPDKSVQIALIRLIVKDTIQQFEHGYHQEFCEIDRNNMESKFWTTIYGSNPSIIDPNYDLGLKNFHLLTEEYVTKVIDDFNIISHDNSIGHWLSQRNNNTLFYTFKGSDYDLSGRFSTIIVDKLWEEINTGVFSNVSLYSRLIYIYHKWLQSLLVLISIQSIDTNILDLFIEALKLLDDGLLLCPDLRNKLLSKLATTIHDSLIMILERFSYSESLKTNEIIYKWNQWKMLAEIKDNSVNRNNVELPKFLLRHLIDTIDYRLDIRDFDENFFTKNQPIKFHNTMNDWPCFGERKWTLSYLLKKMAYRRVPVEIGAKYTSNDWSQKIMFVHEFMNEWIFNNNKPIGYMAQHNLFDQIIDLNKDIDIPVYCALDSDRNDNIDDDDDDDELNSSINFEINAWFGPANTVSPLHFDCRNNLFVQIYGKKFIRLYSSAVPAEQIYPNDADSLLWNTSQIDLDLSGKKLRKKYPKFYRIDSELIYDCVLDEGDVLFIPKNWWHYVRSLSDSFSINYWW